MNDDIKKPPQDNQPVEPPESVETSVSDPVASSSSDVQAEGQQKTIENTGPKELSAQEPASSPVSVNQPQGSQNKPKHEEEHHLIPIILTVIVLVFLVVVAIIADKNKPGKEGSAGSSANTSIQQAPAQATDTKDQQTINDSINDINSLSSSDDTSGQSLSDQNLGL